MKRIFNLSVACCHRIFIRKYLGLLAMARTSKKYLCHFTLSILEPRTVDCFHWQMQRSRKQGSQTRMAVESYGL